MCQKQLIFVNYSVKRSDYYCCFFRRMLDWQELQVPKDKGVANNKKLLSLALSYTGM